MRSQSISLILSAVLVFFFISIKNNYPQSESGIAPYSENPSYWMYNGNPLLLLGGSSEDNLFQIEDLEEEIRTIINCGGNYVRNTLSSRDSGNVWAFHKDKTSGKFNLNMWNEEYWEKLDKFLRLTWQNSIIVQM